MDKVLVIDDSASVRQQVKVALAPSGIEVLEAVDGIDGVEQIQSDTNNNIGMIICDINMPRMNGIELVEWVSCSSKAGRFPILMLTTESGPELIQLAKKAGATGWIIKPFNAKHLVTAVKKFLGV